MLALLLVTGQAFSDEASPAQLLRKQFVNSCVGRAINRQDDAASAAGFCTCAFDVISKELTVAEYIEFDQASREKRTLDTLSAFSRVKAKLTQCKK